MLQPAVLDRTVLWLNHLLSAEPAATQRLMAHAGRSVRIDWQPPAGPWPVPAPVLLRITPAGLCERVEDGLEEPGLEGLKVSVALPAPHELPALWLAGRRPSLGVEGDAQFAADVGWLADNLRWDVEHDLARLVGAAPARELVRLAGGLREALRGVARELTETWSRRPRARAAASR
jgi:ubiquinone biosynthesis protein UbiJ